MRESQASSSRQEDSTIYIPWVNISRAFQECRWHQMKTVGTLALLSSATILEVYYAAGLAGAAGALPIYAAEAVLFNHYGSDYPTRCW